MNKKKSFRSFNILNSITAAGRCTRKISLLHRKMIFHIAVYKQHAVKNVNKKLLSYKIFTASDYSAIHKIHSFLFSSFFSVKCNESAELCIREIVFFASGWCNWVWMTLMVMNSRTAKLKTLFVSFTSPFLLLCNANAAEWHAKRPNVYPKNSLNKKLFDWGSRKSFSRLFVCNKNSPPHLFSIPSWSSEKESK
jgi:hypothetical protein